MEVAVTYLQLLQSSGDDRLTGCLLLAQSHESLNGLLESFSLAGEMGRLHDHK